MGTGKETMFEKHDGWENLKIVLISKCGRLNESQTEQNKEARPWAYYDFWSINANKTVEHEKQRDLQSNQKWTKPTKELGADRATD